MSDPILAHTFENGLVLLGEPIAGVESAAFTLRVPAGTAYEPDKFAGLSTLTCELAARGPVTATAGSSSTISIIWVSSAMPQCLTPTPASAARRWREIWRRR